MIINLGAGKKLLPEAINVDVMDYPGVDIIADLSIFPWPWPDECVNGVCASHILEHFQDQKQFIEECLRILKPGGFLRIVAPHSSCVTNTGCLGHYRTYSYSTFHDYLSKPFYMFKTARFKTVEQKLNWWYEAIDEEKNMPKWMAGIIAMVNPVMNTLIKIITPRVFENVFCPAIQVREIVWEGRKL